jgi:hypothetical protein
MPVIAVINGKEQWLYPKAKWNEINFHDPITTFRIRRDFYVELEEIKD